MQPLLAWKQVSMREEREGERDRGRGGRKGVGEREVGR